MDEMLKYRTPNRVLKRETIRRHELETASPFMFMIVLFYIVLWFEF